MIEKMAWHVCLLGLITIISGVHGFISVGSVVSMVAGLILGGGLLYGTYMMLSDQPMGWWLSLALSGILYLTFVGSFTATGKIYPDGMVSIVSVWVIGALIVGKIWSKQTAH
ncbi:MAG: TMEM14 family protein [bacterium]